MKLGDREFPIDSYDELPYRELVDLRDVLKKGLASPFWLAYREIVDGNARNFEKAILTPAAAPSLDTAFATEFMRGQLASARLLEGVMETFLADIQARLETLQAKESPDDDSPPNVPSGPSSP